MFFLASLCYPVATSFLSGFILGVDRRNLPNRRFPTKKQDIQISSPHKCMWQETRICILIKVNLKSTFMRKATSLKVAYRWVLIEGKNNSGIWKKWFLWREEKKNPQRKAGTNNKLNLHEITVEQ